MFQTLFNLFSSNKTLDLNLDMLYRSLPESDKISFKKGEKILRTLRTSSGDVVKIKSLPNQCNHGQQVYMIYVRRKLDLFAGHIIFNQSKGTITNYGVKTFKYIGTKIYKDTKDIIHTFQTLGEFCYMGHHYKKEGEFVEDVQGMYANIR